ncbi:hypothetical protein MVEN_02183600 [Mycena venus]|uniref:Uncharacterized protein n=1 Tax=Mycena venus TaxID=2733690 RepID=A0A8H6X943_9AGAR|nr:hypothetical protein MVEN_02183600 [Mycena venus]
MDSVDSDFDIFPLEEFSLRSHDRSTTTLTEDGSQSTRDLTRSSVTALQMSKAPKTSVLKSTHTLRILSLTLHCMLVGIHSALMVVWAMGIEHRLAIFQQRQGIVSLLVTATTTAFGTIYSALLVFITQTLSLKRDLHVRQSLTATHDNTAAWAGLGSAALCIWHQRVVPASVRGVLSALFYLGSISILHITVPNMFLLQTVQMFRPVVVETEGLPSFPSTYNLRLSPSGSLYSRRLSASLYRLPAVLGNIRQEGLHEGTLYDVLGANSGAGNVSVDATGFNITCRSFPHARRLIPTPVFLNPGAENRTIALDSTSEVIAYIPSTPPNIISMFIPANGTPHAERHGLRDRLTTGPLFIYTTIPIIDSSGASGPWLNFPQPVQVFQCTQSLVKQIAVIDARSRKVLEIGPNIKKTSSGWLPAKPFEYDPNGPTRNPLIDAWDVWFEAIPRSEFALSIAVDFPYRWYASVADLYLIQKFNLAATEAFKRPSNVTLHDFENALSTIVATVFWTLGHVPLSYGEIESGRSPVAEYDQRYFLKPPRWVPILLKGNATVSEICTETRLTMNIVAIVVGLSAAMVLALVSLRYSFLYEVPRDREDVTIDGAGILHTIWLYRNHSELAGILGQVEDPTNNNLRKAGMVDTIFGRQLQKPTGAEPFDLINFDTIPLEELSLHGEITADSTEDASQSNIDLPDSTRTAVQAQNTPSSGLCSRSLRLLSLTLHLTLVGIHLGLICVYVIGPEHRLVVSLERQGIASFLVTGITTTFTTIYSALLVLTTQTLSMRRDLQIQQTLTATHDNAAAWAGLGSAAFRVWQQRDVSASLNGVLSAFFYLGNVALLQVTMSSMFALQTVTVLHSGPVATQSLPFYPSSYRNYGSAFSEPWTAFARGSLQSLPLSLSNSSSEGLYGGTLYDVVGANVGMGNITVNATGFNISCRSFPEAHSITVKPSKDWRTPYLPTWKVALDSAAKVVGGIRPAAPDIISTFRLMDDDFRSDSLLIYSTIPIVDSQGTFGPWLNFTRPFRCSQLLVNQTAVIDAKSRKVLDIQPSFHKTSSTWFPSAPLRPGLNGSRTENSFIDAWARWYNAMPDSEFSREQISSGNPNYISVADLYLIQKLNLAAMGYSQRPTNVTLHDLENALSTIVAAMFWTLGHVPPLHGSIVEGTDDQLFLDAAVDSPILLKGVATVREMVAVSRLNLNIIPVVIGLGASIALAWISLRYSLYHGVPREAEDVTIDGTGILHTIWLYRKQPELGKLLKQVDHPTDKSLRKAGMVKIIFGGQLQKHGDRPA